MKKHRKWATLLIVPALLIFASFSAFAQVPELVVGDGAAEKGDTDTVTLAITDVTDLGAIDLELSFDPAVVQETNISWGDFGTASAHLVNNTTGVIEMNWISIGGLDGNFDLCDITFSAVGGYPECSDLDLTFTDVVSASGPPISHTIDNGEFCVLESPEPAPAVGGTAYLPNKAGMLAPWIVLGVTLAVVISWLARKRRRARV